MAVPPLVGALLKNEQDVTLFEKLVFMQSATADERRSAVPGWRSVPLGGTARSAKGSSGERRSAAPEALNPPRGDGAQRQGGRPVNAARPFRRRSVPLGGTARSAKGVVR